MALALLTRHECMTEPAAATLHPKECNLQGEGIGAKIQRDRDLHPVETLMLVGEFWPPSRLAAMATLNDPAILAPRKPQRWRRTTPSGRTNNAGDATMMRVNGRKTRDRLPADGARH